MRIFVTVLLAFGACFGQIQPQAAQPQPIADLSGKVQAEDGAAIGGAVVTVIREMEAGIKFRRFTATQRAQPDGLFAFSGVTPGLYRLCVQVANSTWLDPCEWGKLPMVRLSPGSPVKNVIVKMKKGVALAIRVDDPGQLLSQHEGKTPGAHLLIGVGNDAYVFVPAAIVSKDGNGRDQQVLVPVDTPVKVMIYSRFFQLADSQANAISSSGVGLPVLIPSGQQPVPLKVKITGASGH